MQKHIIKNLSQPFIDILVTTYQRATDLLVLMNNLEHQMYRNFRLQIFDGSVDDAVERTVSHYLDQQRIFPYTIVFHKTVAGMTRQRNIAVDYTQGDISIFLDDDVELEPAYLQQIIAVFGARPDVAAMNGFDTQALVFSGGKKIGKRKSLYRKLGLLPDIGPARYLPWGHGTSHFVDSEKRGVVEVDLLIGHNMAFRTALLKEFRFANFYEDYPTYVLYDDQDICLRLRKKYKLVLNYDARLKHNISPSGRPPKTHYGFQAFFNAYRNWKLFGEHNWKSTLKFWGWELLDIILQLPNSKTRNVSWGRITAIAYVALGYTRYSEIKKK
jgi:glycosyltransferase involved in cell wall biosynthesis